MGEGLYHARGGYTVYVEPFEDAGDDPVERDEAMERLMEAVRASLTRHWRSVEPARCRDRAAVVMASMVFELTLHHDSYERVHVSVVVREDLDEDTEATARAMLAGVARFVFRRLAARYPLRRRTSAWTSTSYDPREREAAPP